MDAFDTAPLSSQEIDAILEELGDVNTEDGAIRFREYIGRQKEPVRKKILQILMYEIDTRVAALDCFIFFLVKDAIGVLSDSEILKQEDYEGRLGFVVITLKTLGELMRDSDVDELVKEHLYSEIGKTEGTGLESYLKEIIYPVLVDKTIGEGRVRKHIDRCLKERKERLIESKNLFIFSKKREIRDINNFEGAERLKKAFFDEIEDVELRIMLFTEYANDARTSDAAIDCFSSAVFTHFVKVFSKEMIPPEEVDMLGGALNMMKQFMEIREHSAEHICEIIARNLERTIVEMENSAPRNWMLLNYFKTSVREMFSDKKKEPGAGHENRKMPPNLR